MSDAGTSHSSLTLHTSLEGRHVPDVSKNTNQPLESTEIEPRSLVASQCFPSLARENEILWHRPKLRETLLTEPNKMKTRTNDVFFCSRYSWQPSRIYVHRDTLEVCLLVVKN